MPPPRTPSGELRWFGVLAERALLRLKAAKLRFLLFCLAVTWALQLSDALPHSVADEADLSVAVSRILRSQGLRAAPGEVYWLDTPTGALTRVRRARAIARAQRPGELADIYLLDVKLSPEGRLLDLDGSYNITDTSAVDERNPAVSGPRVAWVIQSGGKVSGVHYADLRGETPAPKVWSALAVWQNQLTNLQETGRREGIGRRAFKLNAPAAHVLLAYTPEALIIDADGRRTTVPTEVEAPLEGGEFVHQQLYHKARPGNLITWAVDRIRAMRWFGSDRMQLVKAVAFDGIDRAERLMGEVTGDDGSQEVASELGELMSRPPSEYTDPETGWPPAPMQP
ncbi:MAG TPA: hypothetical protein VGJ84_00455, partial [Polyangiaceae bacterium]